MLGFLNIILAAAGDKEFDIFLAVVIVAIAILIIAVVLYNRRPSEKDFPPPPPPAPPLPLSSPAKQPEVLPENVSIVYSGLERRTVFFCPCCDCEYPSSKVTCEICGKSLQRRNINDM